MTNDLRGNLGEDRLFVAGTLRKAHNNETFENVDPTTEQVLGLAADADSADADEALAAAREAFDRREWSTNVDLRVRCLEQLKRAIVEHSDELRAVLIAEAGCPLSFTRSIQLDEATVEIDDAIREAQNYGWERAFDETGSILSREPRGVVSAITPFNYPLYLNLRKTAHALAAGCTVVLKPSPETPWSASVLGRLAAENTDLPAGVFNVLTSTDPDVSHMLTADARVDMVAFVGSSAVGRQIMAQAAPTLKKLVLELGGKSASVILDDADLSAAAAVAGRVGLHAGQGCSRLTRFLVARSRYDEAVAIARSAFGAIVVGDPRDEATIQGPQISRRQQERVIGLIERAVGDGATVAFGGRGVPADRPTGFFVEPTLLVDVDPNSEIAQEEIFGPVAVMIPFDDDDHAVEIANNSVYGLSGAVNSRDEDRALSVARSLRTGQVLVNNSPVPTGSPFSGWKQSGVGLDNGILGFEEHLETKIIGVAAGSFG